MKRQIEFIAAAALSFVLCYSDAVGQNAIALERLGFPELADLVGQFQQSLNTCDAELLRDITATDFINIGVPSRYSPFNGHSADEFEAFCREGFGYNLALNWGYSWYGDHGRVLVGLVEGEMTIDDNPPSPIRYQFTLYVYGSEETGEWKIVHLHTSPLPPNSGE